MIFSAMNLPSHDNPTVLAHLAIDIADDEAYSNVTADLALSSVTTLSEGDIAGLLKLNGKLSFTHHASCSRCLKPVSTPIESGFETIVDIDEGTTAAVDYEAPAEPGGFEMIRDHEIDFTDEVRQRIYLGTPSVIYCRSDCKGLCPQCGTDLNVRPCKCGDKKTGSPFEVLRGFSGPMKEKKDKEK